MFRGTSSSVFISLGMIIRLEMSMLLGMTRKGTTGLRVDLFCPYYDIYPKKQLKVASTP